MSRSPSDHFTAHPAVRSLRKWAFMVLDLMRNQLRPFAPAGHAPNPSRNRIVSWGDNAGVPAALATQSIRAINGGHNASIAITANGEVVSWGEYCCANASVKDKLNDPIAVAVGAYSCLALNRDGSVVAWDRNGPTPVPEAATDVTAIAAGEDFYLALTHAGKVVAWGDNAHRQLDVPPDLANARVTAISAKWASSLALKSDGTVVWWGRGSQAVPPEVNAPKNVTAIANGMMHALALTSDGTVEAWGDNSFGETNVPVGLTDVVDIAAGYGYSLALKRDGSLVAWGDGAVANLPGGQLNHVTAIAGGWTALAVQALGA